MPIIQKVLPVLRNMKDYGHFLKSDHEFIIFLEVRLAQLPILVRAAKQSNKKVIVHPDLIQGLKADLYGLEFLIKEINPAGIISTRCDVIELAKKNKLLTIQRLHLMDGLDLEGAIQKIGEVDPDFIEVLPGIIPSVIEEVRIKTGIPVIAGGEIQTMEEVGFAFSGGAAAIATQQTELWKI